MNVALTLRSCAVMNTSPSLPLPPSQVQYATAVQVPLYVVPVARTTSKNRASACGLVPVAAIYIVLVVATGWNIPA